ncbi:MAG: ATP-binding protein [Planctomycetota bacterium]|jgi:signal transduction histidine kinase
MAPRDATSATPVGPDDPEASLSLRQLAHELNSLLDGSLRYVSLALRLLEELDAVGEGSSRDPVSAKLRHAQGAMVHMADLLERVMRRNDTTARVLARRQTIAQELRWLAEMVEPMASAEGVRLTVDIAPEAGNQPVGALGTVLLNGLRNAVQACTRGAGTERWVEVVVRLVDPDTLDLVIADTGPGPGDGAATPGGHGLGMVLSRQIVEQLGGTMSLTAPAGGRGTELRVNVPLEALSEAGP